MKNKKQYRDIDKMEYSVTFRFRLPETSLSKMTVTDYETIKANLATFMTNTMLQNKLDDLVVSTMQSLVPDIVEVYVMPNEYDAK